MCAHLKSKGKERETKWSDPVRQPKKKGVSKYGGKKQKEGKLRFGAELKRKREDRRIENM